MTFRDPKSPTPRRGEGSRGEGSGQDRVRGGEAPLAPSRDPAARPAPSGRRVVDTGAERRAAGARPVPGSQSSRSVADPFAQPSRDDTRRAATGGDPLAARGRQARSAPAAPPATDDPNDPAAWGDLAGDWAEPGADEWEELPAAEPVRRQAPSRRRSRDTARARTARTRPAINLPAARVPGFVAQADLLTDQISGILIGANLLSLVVMVIRLATGLGQLPPSLVVHLDAAGIPDMWATPGVLWRLPLIAGMTLLMNVVVAWFVSPIDRFAARFVLAAALGVQLIVWVAVLQLV